MLFFKLDYAIEKEQAGRRQSARCDAYAASATRPKSGAFGRKLQRVAKQLAVIYLTHQSWKAHDGLSVPAPSVSEQATERVVARQPTSRRRALRKLAGVKVSASEADAAWLRVLDHKWYLSEQLGRDVGLRVAAVDFFENIEPPRRPVRSRAAWTPLPRLPMMMPFDERFSL